MNQLFPLLPLRDIVVFPGHGRPAVRRPRQVGRRARSRRWRRTRTSSCSPSSIRAATIPSATISTTSAWSPGAPAAQAARRHRARAGRGRRARGADRDARRETGSSSPKWSSDEPMTAAGNEVVAMMRQVVEQFGEYAKLNKKLREDAGARAWRDRRRRRAGRRDRRRRCSGKVADKQALLTEADPLKRLEMVMSFMEGELVGPPGRAQDPRPGEAPDGEDPARILPQRAAQGDPERAGRRSGEDGDEIAELPTKIDKLKLSKEARAKAEGELKKLKTMQPMSAEATVIRNYLDVLLGLPWGKKTQAQEGHRQGAGGPRRGSLRAGKGQGPDRRVSRGAGAHQQAEGADPVPRRPSRRGQDQPRQVDRQGDRARIRAPVAGRRARRGRNPRPPPHLHRLAAGQDRHQPAQGRDSEPAVPARRDRQARPGFPRRSGVGAARGARPRAERQVPGPLPRTRLRPVATSCS